MESDVYELITKAVLPYVHTQSDSFQKYFKNELYRY